MTYECLLGTNLQSSNNSTEKAIQSNTLLTLLKHAKTQDQEETKLVRQFVWSLKENTFEWYTNLEPKVIDNWQQLETEFLNRFYSTRCVVSMKELTNTKQRKGKLVIDYINRWRALSLDCKDKLT